MYAVIEAQGRQHLVHAGDTIQLEGPATVGDSMTFDRVLSVGGRLGNPVVSGAKVVGKVVGVGKGPKIYVQKFRRRQHYRRRTGFRATLFQVHIDEITE